MLVIKSIFASLIFIHIAVILVKTAKSSSLFYEINDQLLAAVDNVFIALKIDKNFTKSENLTDFMSMHNIVQDAVERNDKKYENFIETSKTKIGDKTAYFVSCINEITEEVKWQQTLKQISDIFNKTNDSKGDVLSNFVNLEKALNVKKNSLTNNLKLWDTDYTSVFNTRRLYGGNRTVVRRYPFMASVHVHGRFTCGGSLIREDLVITAASCLMHYISRRFIIGSVQVRVGSDYTNKFGQLIPIVDVWYHPLFNKTTLHHNLVILRLKTLLKLKKRTLITIDFDTDAKKMPRSVKGVMILGWGQECLNCEAPERDQFLSKAFINLYDLKDCMKIYSRTYVTTRNFCAGYSLNGPGACKNDIGGPAIVGSTLMGVISFGSPQCGRSRSPTVLTKLGYYADWINMVFNAVCTFAVAISRFLFISLFIIT